MSQKTNKVTSSGPKPSITLLTDKEPLFKKLFLGLIGILLLVIPYFSKDTGINGDERFQVYIARYIVPFYTSFGKDRRVLLTRDEVKPVYDKGGMDSVKKEFNVEMVPQENNLKNYGGGFELLSALVAKVFGYNTDEQMGFHTVRHVLLGIITVLIMLFAGLCAKELLGWRAAFITVLLLLISPRFIGDGMMNNKDIPFALGYIITLYFIIRFIKQLPTPDIKNTIGVMLGFAAALNIRVGGLLLIIYFGMFCVLFWFYYQSLKKRPDYNSFNLRASVTKAVAASFIGYFLGMLFWPYGLLNPISNPIAVLQEQAKFPVFIPQLFEGKVVSSNDLPWYYLTKFILMSNPEVVLIGVLVAAYMLYRYKDSINLGWVGIVLFVIFFPLFYISYSRSNVYNGWRHVIFIYPPLVVIAALGYDLLLTTLQKTMRYAAIALIVVLSLLPVSWIVAEHPYEYTYFNQTVGGISGAYGYYVTDYWMMSIREASTWLTSNVINKGNEKVIVATDCVYPLQVYMKNQTDKASLVYCRYNDRNNKDWDYGIFYSEYVSPTQLQKGTWPPDGTIYQVKAGGVPLCAVIKRTDKSDYLGHKALEANQFQQAIELLEKAKGLYPKNDGVWMDLGLAYLSVRQLDKGVEALKQSAKLYPDNAMVYYYLGMAYAQGNPPDYKSTKYYMKKALEVKPDFAQAQQVLDQLKQAGGDSSPGL